MNCPNCKNPIQDNYTECEWCGNKIIASIQEKKILFFTAKRCGPSKLVLPIIQKYKRETSTMNIEIVDVDLQTKTTSDYNITHIPTLIAIKNGVIVDKLMGAQPSKVIHMFINSNI